VTNLACPYIHDPSKLNQNENMKKRFNVDSPSFTPLQATTNGSLTPSSRGAAISPKAANAAIFTPKSQRSSELAAVLLLSLDR
jgi:PAB-dependent poly(A)-specific ribonuclease subunit 3